MFPEVGVIRVESARMFGAPDEHLCRRFLQAVLRLRVIEEATLVPSKTPSVELRFDGSRHSRKNVLGYLASALRRGGARDGANMPVAPAITARDRHGVVRYRRVAGRITAWHAERERVGWIRLNNTVLHRKRALCDAIERELMSVLEPLRYLFAQVPRGYRIRPTPDWRCPACRNP